MLVRARSFWFSEITCCCSTSEFNAFSTVSKAFFSFVATIGKLLCFDRLPSFHFLATFFHINNQTNKFKCSNIVFNKWETFESIIDIISYNHHKWQKIVYQYHLLLWTWYPVMVENRLVDYGETFVLECPSGDLREALRKVVLKKSTFLVLTRFCYSLWVGVREYWIVDVILSLMWLLQ
jgi:hypothetical protein